MIQLINVVKTFKTKENNVHAVKGINLEIADGQIYGIIGYSGAGKSTIIRMLNYLEKPTSGTILIDGVDLSKLSNNELRKRQQKIGMIFQHFNLLTQSTVFENIEVALIIAGVEKSKRQNRVNELIQLVGLVGKESAYPSELSGGQKQRVGIARALANNPDILLCDEATSALDPETTDSILDLLKQINKTLNLTIVLITHQMEVVEKICNRIAVMNDGLVVEEGSVEELFKNPKDATTKRFVSTINDRRFDNVKQELIQLYPYGKLLRLFFDQTISSKPILMNTLKNTTFSCSIVHADIATSLNGSFGTMYIHIADGSDSEYKAFEANIKQQGVELEVIS